MIRCILFSCHVAYLKSPSRPKQHRLQVKYVLQVPQLWESFIPQFVFGLVLFFERGRGGGVIFVVLVCFFCMEKGILFRY